MFNYKIKNLNKINFILSKNNIFAYFYNYLIFHKKKLLKLQLKENNYKKANLFIMGKMIVKEHKSGMANMIQL